MSSRDLLEVLLGALAVAIVIALAVAVAAEAAPAPREQRAAADAQRVGLRLGGFDTYSVRCGPRFCRWYLDDLEQGRTCTARPGGTVRCYHWRVPTPDPYPGGNK